MVFGVSSELRMLMRETWDIIVKDCQLWAMPEGLLECYNNIYREIIANIIYLHANNNGNQWSPVWKYIDLHEFAVQLCGSTYVNPDEISHAANMGCGIAQSIMDDYNGDDEAFEMRVGDSVYDVFVTNALFLGIDEMVWRDLVIGHEFLDDCHVVVCGNFTKVVLTDDPVRFI